MFVFIPGSIPPVRFGPRGTDPAEISIPAVTYIYIGIVYLTLMGHCFLRLCQAAGQVQDLRGKRWFPTHAAATAPAEGDNEEDDHYTPNNNTQVGILRNILQMTFRKWNFGKCIVRYLFATCFINFVDKMWTKIANVLHKVKSKLWNPFTQAHNNNKNNNNTTTQDNAAKNYTKT